MVPMVGVERNYYYQTSDGRLVLIRDRSFTEYLGPGLDFRTGAQVATGSPEGQVAFSYSVPRQGVRVFRDSVELHSLVTGADGKPAGVGVQKVPLGTIHAPECCWEDLVASGTRSVSLEEWTTYALRLPEPDGFHFATVRVSVEKDDLSHLDVAFTYQALPGERQVN